MNSIQQLTLSYILKINIDKLTTTKMTDPKKYNSYF